MISSTSDVDYAGETGCNLDLFSTSQTDNPTKQEKRFSLCAYGAPFFAYQIKLATYGVVQGCCNHWDCPRCGVQRAKEEYGRIVSGIRQMANSSPIFFVTITCLGKDVSLDVAYEHYLEWTNRFLTAFRSRLKRADRQWCYCAVTERQTRGHPHSHLLGWLDPLDCYIGYKKTNRDENGQFCAPRWVETVRSDWLYDAVLSAGLGPQYDISVARSVEATSRYIAKYLFKGSVFSSEWPKGWKRVRYSQNFPKLPEKETDAFVLLAESDWRLLGKRAEVVLVKEPTIADDVKFHLRHADTRVSLS